MATEKQEKKPDQPTELQAKAQGVSVPLSASALPQLVLLAQRGLAF